MVKRKLFKLLYLLTFSLFIFSGCSKNETVSTTNTEDSTEYFQDEDVSNEQDISINDLLASVSDNIKITYESDMYGEVVAEFVGNNQHISFTRQNRYGYYELVDDYYIDNIDYLCIMCNEDETNHLICVSAELPSPCFTLPEILDFNSIEIKNINVLTEDITIEDKNCTEILITDVNNQNYYIYTDNETNNIYCISAFDTIYTYEKIEDIELSDIAQSSSTITSEQLVNFANDGLNLTEDCSLASILEKYSDVSQ